MPATFNDATVTWDSVLWTWDGDAVGGDSALTPGARLLPRASHHLVPYGRPSVRPLPPAAIRSYPS